MSLTKQAVSGSKWNTISLVTRTVLQFVQMVALANILSPRDYGLVGMMSFFIGISSVLVDMGLSSSIMHAKDVTKNQLSSLYWLNVFLGFFIFLLIVLVSKPIANFYNEKEIGQLIIFMGLGLFLNSFSFQHQFLLLKDLMFKETAVFNIGIQLLSLTVSITMALLGFGVYSLIVPNIVVSIVSSVLLIYYMREKYLPQIYFSLKEIKRFLNYSLFQTGSNLITYFNSQLDTLIVGYFTGAEIAGYYFIAKNLIQRPSQIINPIIGNVSGPLMSKVNSEISRLESAYLKIIHYTSLVSFPIHALFFLLADFLIRFIYGEKWVEAIYPLKILSLVYFFRGLISPIGSLVVATGKASLSFYFNVLQLVTIPIFLIVYNKFGIAGFLYAQLIAIFISFVLHYFMMIKPMLPTLSFLKFVSSFSLNLVLNLFVVIIGLVFIHFTGTGVIASIVVFGIYATLVFAANYKLNPQFNELLVLVKLKKQIS
jgi:O-antigen/teichoic acid export membrane protein